MCRPVGTSRAALITVRVARLVQSVFSLMHITSCVGCARACRPWARGGRAQALQDDAEQVFLKGELCAEVVVRVVLVPAPLGIPGASWVKLRV